MHLHVEKMHQIESDYSRLWIEQIKKFSRASHSIIIKPPHYEDGIYAPTHYYVLATNHMYAKSAELVHTKKPRLVAMLADSLLCSVMSQLSFGTYR